MQVRKYLDHMDQYQFKFKFISEYLERWLTKQTLNADPPHLKKKIDPNMVTNAPYATFVFITIYG